MRKRIFYNDDYTARCTLENGMFAMPHQVRQFGLAAIDTLLTSPMAQEWVVESVSH